MAVDATTVETYDTKTVREDLREAYDMVSPEETPYHQIAGRRTVTNPHYEYPAVDLAAPDLNNHVAEGEDTPGTDAPTLADRLSNHTQISDKTVSVSHTSDAVDGAAENIQELAEQVALKIRELKRDCEAIALDNEPAVPGAGDGASTRQTAGVPAHLRTNYESVGAGTSVTPPTLSADPDGYPSTGWAFDAWTPGAITEDAFNALIQKCWDAGADPTVAMVNSNNKRVISSTFTGASTRYKDAVDKRLVHAVDIYTSDFGELQIVPNRFLPALDNDGSSLAGTQYGVLLLDPEYCRIVELEGTKQKPLAETGHSRKRLIWREWGTECYDMANGIIPDTSGAAA